ncbi:hypothetical protein G7054_g352 [Neopestalotiopsis clavispora]|nr:hypothetical protein G7054_g352 [Neopestalotiopsis clavispora]
MIVLQDIIDQVRDAFASSPILLISALIGFYFVSSSVCSWYRLRHIPGPWLASWSYLWMFRQGLNMNQGILYRNITDKYGHLARIGPNDLVTDDPEVIRRMSAARSPYGRSDWYQPLRMNPHEDSLFSMQDTAAHDKLKAQLSFGYGGKENPTIEDGVDEQIHSLHALIRRKYLSAPPTGGDAACRPLDLAVILQYFTLDSLTRIAYGEAFGYLKTDSDVHDYIKTSEEYVPIIVMCAEIPFLRHLFMNKTLLAWIGPKATDKKGIGKLVGVARDIVNKRMSSQAEDQRDMLGSFIRHGVGRNALEGEIPFQIIAGSDTTATALRGTMLSLMTTPYAYQALQTEIDEAIAQGAISSIAKAEEGKPLTYLQARLSMKQVPPQGDTIQGYFVPSGTRVGHSFIGVERSEEIFGNNVDVFKPERWLGIDPDKRREMAQVVELVFGHGRWGCAGKPVALMELNKIYIELLRHYDFQLIDPSKPMRVMNCNIYFASDLWVRVTERSKQD